MRAEYKWFVNMDAERRAWVHEMVERFAWPVCVAIQEAHCFGLNRKSNWVHDYRTGKNVEYEF